MAEVIQMQYSEHNFVLGKFISSLIPTFLLQDQLTVFIIVAEVENTWFFLSGSMVIFYSESNTLTQWRKRFKTTDEDHYRDYHVNNSDINNCQV